ncbi:MAG: sulfatase-like hydrolase/transferase, partial [Actinomycetota bacterium]
PNRSSNLTGRLPSAHGVVFNDRSLDPGTTTFVGRLAAAGYRTDHIGKAHLQIHGRALFPTPEEASVGHLGWPPGWDTLEDAARYVEDDPGPVREFYGFDRAEFCLGHGPNVGGHHLRWALTRGFDPSTAGGGPNGPAATRSPHWWQVLQPVYDEGFHSTEFVTARTVELIEQGAGGDQPWFLFASYPDPHHPFAPPGPWYDRHDPADMVVPASFDDPVDDLPRFLREMAISPGARGPMRIGEAALRAAMAAQYGAIECIDAGVGRMLGALEASGQADDTIVVFTADHGDMFGDHGFMLKGGLVFEGTTRVPLLIARPGGAGTRTSSLASSLDLGPTMLDLLGIDGFDGIQGVSLVPLLDRPAAEVRDHVLIEEDVPSYGIWANPVPEHSRTIVTADARLTRYSTGEGELYDLVADRGERRNLFGHGDGRVLRTDLTEQLAEAMIGAADLARPEPGPAPPRTRR